MPTPSGAPATKRSSGKGCLIAAIVVVAVVILGVVAAGIAISVGARRVSDELSDLGRTSADEARDVEVARCDTNAAGLMHATLSVTNHSPKASNYVITVSFNSRGGGTRLDTGSAFVSSLAPDQTTEAEALGTERPPGEGDFECRVSFVQRLSAEG
jgi:hypothetical protein